LVPHRAGRDLAVSGRRGQAARRRLRLIKMIIAPLIFSTLVVGIAGAGDMKSVGRIGLKAMIYFEVATTIALVIGLELANVFKPGAGLAIPLAGDTSAVAAFAKNQQSAWDMFLHLFPTSVVDAMARGDILQVVVFSLFFGVARCRR
jgi:proton glutamate symport protein